MMQNNNNWCENNTSLFLYSPMIDLSCCELSEWIKQLNFIKKDKTIESMVNLCTENKPSLILS